jgi:hypothetical protein
MSGFLNPNPRAADCATPVTGNAYGGRILARCVSFKPFIGKPFIGVLFLLSLGGARSASANGSFYYDIAGGISKYQQTSPFFGKTTAGSTGFGYALNNGIFVNFGGDQSLFAFQFGLQHRLSAASDAMASYAVQAAYPVLRLQFTRIYLSTGFTPFVWRRANAMSGLDNFSRANSTTALLAEAGFLMPITPKFSFGVQGSGQFISGNGAQSPNPILDATVSMRFYFGFFGNGGGKHSSGEFKGWRYPFGFMR